MPWKTIFISFSSIFSSMGRSLVQSAGNSKPHPKEITKLKATIKAYIHEAVEVEKSGVKVEYKKNTELNFPEEFQHKLKAIPALKKAFEALTPGRQRAYNLYFSSAKQSQTRASRIEKYIPQILSGKGLDD